MLQADKDLFGDDCDGPSSGGGKGAAGGAGGGGGGGGSEPDSDSDEENVETPDAIRRRAERDAFKLREVFLSRQMETLPATLIRSVNLTDLINIWIALYSLECYRLSFYSFS